MEPNLAVVITYWQIAILFISFSVVSTGLAVFLVWESGKGKVNTSAEIEAQAIREHYADEEKTKHKTKLVVVR